MFALLSLALLVSAAPSKRQGLDFAQIVDDAPFDAIVPPVDVAFETVDLSASAAAAVATAPLLQARGVNDPCAAQPPGIIGFTPSPDTPDAFLAYGPFATAATSAQVPANYVQTFSNLQAEVSQLAYAGIFTLDSYDPSQCANICNTAYGCLAFNLAFERDPVQNPAAGCENPASLVNSKCILWGFPTSPESVTNVGQTRTQFQVVIAGSNGYSKTQQFAAQPVTNFTGPVVLPAAINAKAAAGYMGYKLFTTAFDPSICAKACQDTSAYNQRHAAPGQAQICRAFNVYILSKDNVAQGFICSMYQFPQYINTQADAVNTGYSTKTPPAKYTVNYSYFYTLTAGNTGSAVQEKK